jgi:hypothetical protein
MADEKPIILTWTRDNGALIERRWELGLSAGLDILEYIAQRYPEMSIQERHSIKVFNEATHEDATNLAMQAAEDIVRSRGWAIFVPVAEAGRDDG